MKNKDLYNSSKKEKTMKIAIPPKLSSEELKCFNEIVKPQLEELYSYSYNISKFENIKIFISKNKFPDNMLKPDIEQINQILNKVPEEHLKLVSSIYFVSYHCKDDNHKDVKGRTLPITYDIIVFPKAKEKLNIILAHEIGHIIFEKHYTLGIKSDFASALFQTFLNVRFKSINEYDHFIKEQFADCYDNFINNPERLKKGFPYIYSHFVNHV